MNLRWLGSALVVVAAGVVLHGGQTTPTFRSGVRFVEVDAVVTDRSGRFTADLTREDFEILEDGAPQEIRTFSLVDLPVDERGRPLEAVLATTDADTPDLAATPWHGRIYVIVLDSGSTERVRAIARRLITEYVTDTDLAAVLHVGAPARMQGLTSDRELLLQSVEQYVPGASHTCSGAVLGCLAFKTLKDVAVNLKAVTGRRKAIVFIGEGAAMWPVEGQKIALPFMTELWREYRDAIQTTARHNVRIYPFDPRGFTVKPPDLTTESARPAGLHCQPAHPPSDGCFYFWPGPAGSNGSDDWASSLRLLAEDTGGVATVNTNNVAGGLRALVRDHSTYYVLGYYSPAELDGRRHRITVRVRNRPDLSVRESRSSYTATTPDVKGRAVRMPGGLSRPVRDLLRAADTAGANASLDVVTAVFQAERYDGSILIGAHVPATSLRLDPKARIELAYAAVDRWGTVRAAERRVFTLNLSAATQARVREGGLRLYGRLRVPRGRYDIRVAAHQTDGLIASGTAEVEVPDFADAALTVSDLVVASAQAPARLTLEEDPVLRRALPDQPTPERRFASTDTLTLFSEIYDSQWILSRVIAVTSTVTARDGRLVVRNEQVLDSAGRGRFHYTGRVPLARFAPDTYTLSVEATTRSGVPALASRQMTFEVVEP